MKPELLATSLLLPAFLWAGCATAPTAQVQATRQMPIRVEAHETVAIVVSHDATELASEAVGCISEALKDGFPNLRVIFPEEFHRTAFPHVAVELAPRALIYLPLLLNDPTFRARIAQLGLRYLISIQGKTEERGKPIVKGGGAAPFGAATILGMEWERKSNVTVTILDLKQDIGAGEIRASAEGNPWVVCVGLGPICLPLGAPAFTEAKACDRIGSAVAKFFAGEDTSGISTEAKQVEGK